MHSFSQSQSCALMMTKEAEEQGEMEGSTGSDSKDKKDKEEEEREGDLHWGWTEKSISGRKTGMVDLDNHSRRCCVVATAHHRPILYKVSRSSRVQS